MPQDNWVTYSREQAKQVSSGLQVLLNRGVLDSDEQELAKKIQRKLSNWPLGEETTMVPLNNKEYTLVNQVEAALWR